MESIDSEAESSGAASAENAPHRALDDEGMTKTSDVLSAHCLVETLDEDREEDYPEDCHYAYLSGGLLFETGPVLYINPELEGVRSVLDVEASQ